MSETEQKIYILKTQIEQIEKDMKDAEERIKTAKEEDKSLLIHIISTGELEVFRLREELESLRSNLLLK